MESLYIPQKLYHERLERKERAPEAGSQEGKLDHKIQREVKESGILGTGFSCPPRTSKRELRAMWSYILQKYFIPRKGMRQTLWAGDH